MLTLDRPQDAILNERGAARSVRVRVCPNGPVVDLPVGKTTIGSSPRCNIRLQQPGIQPLHCLILNEADGLSVRRWAGETVLNGRPVEESAVEAGDCLRVGPAELEILQPQVAAPFTAQPLAMPLPSTTAVLEPPISSLVLPSAPIAPKQADSIYDRVGLELARSRGRRLLAALRKGRALQSELQGRVAQLERELERAATDRKDFAGRLRNLRSELTEARQQAAAQQSLSAANQELASQNEQLGREVCSLIERIELLTSELTESSATLQATVGEKESLAAESRRLADESGQLREQLQQQNSRYSEVSAERDEARSQSDLLRAELHSVGEREDAASGRAERLDYELSVLQQQVAELANQNSALSGEREEAWEQCESLRSNVHALSERESSLAQNVARLEQETSRQQQQVAGLSSQIAALGSERDEAARQCESLRLEVETASARESALTETVHRLEHESNQHQLQATERSNQIAALASERDETLRQCESLRAEIETAKDRESELTETVHRLEHEASQHQLQATEHSNQIAVLGSERDEALQQIESLRSEIQSLTEREASLSQEICRLEQETAQRANDSAELTNQIGALRAEHDDFRDQNEQLRSQVRNFAQERATLTEEHAANNRELESLRAQSQAVVDKEDKHAEQIAELTAECQRYREEADRLPQLEQQIRDTVAERENTSSELYRALLQLAEMQERDDHHATLEAAHRALNAELDKSTQDIAALQAKIDRLAEDRIAADEARQSLDRKAAELIEAHQQLAFDKATLSEEITELREQLEAACLRETDSAARLEAADTWRQQLAEVEITRSELTETVTRLETELESKEQSGVTAAATIAERDRQIADYAKRLAESSEAVRLLESNTAASTDAQAQFEQSRDEWRHERQELEREHSQLSQQVSQLAAQLAKAEAAAEQATQFAADQMAKLVAVELAAAQASTSLSSGRTSLELDTELESEIVTSKAAKSDTERGFENVTQSAEVQGPNPFNSSSKTDEPRPESEVDSTSEESYEPRIPESDGERTQDEPPQAVTEEGGPNSTVDAWNSTRSQDLAAVSWSSTEAALNETSVEESEIPSPTAQPASYIERYSHLFANEEAVETQPAPAVVMPANRENEKRRSSGVVRSSGTTPSAGADDEESIEEYMAKLLQRVRGGSAAEATAPTQDSERVPPMSAPASYTSMPLTAPHSSDGGDFLSPMGFDPSKRKSPMPAPQTDLEALRALANESARRAISRHALRKHRRNATTKVIVSALAGMTSLWLMLDSEHWWNWQFIAACLSLLVAAYWACETLRALFVSHRAASPDETDEEIEELSAQLRSPLPIDVE